MKATLSGTYSGSGGRQPISIQGDLAVEGLNVEAILEKLCELQGQVTALQATVSRLQEQCIRSSVGELGKALETMKEEPPAAEAPIVEEPVVTVSKKKKTTTTET